MTADDDRTQIVEGQERRESFEIRDDIASWAAYPHYRLDRVEFHELRKQSTLHERAAAPLLWIAIGEFLLMLGKAFDWSISTTRPTTLIPGAIGWWEVWALIITLVAFGLAVLVGLIWPSNRRETIQRIEDHFTDNPPRTLFRQER